MAEPGTMPVCTADLYDAHPALLQVSDLQFRAFGLRRSFWGQAATLRVFEDHTPVLAALSAPGQDRVLVVDAGGSLRVGVMGDRIAAIAARNGWAGVVIAGAIRDSAGINALDIGVRALGTTARRGWTATQGESGIPAALGTLVVQPGHWVYCDEDAVLASAAFIDPSTVAPAALG